MSKVKNKDLDQQAHLRAVGDLISVFCSQSRGYE